ILYALGCEERDQHVPLDVVVTVRRLASRIAHQVVVAFDAGYLRVIAVVRKTGSKEPLRVAIEWRCGVSRGAQRIGHEVERRAHALEGWREWAWSRVERRVVRCEQERLRSVREIHRRFDRSAAQGSYPGLPGQVDLRAAAANADRECKRCPYGQCQQKPK